MKCPHCNGELPPDKNCICQDPAPALREAEIGKIIFTELNKWVYNDENQAGIKLRIIDAEDFRKIIPEIAQSIKAAINK